MPFIDQTKAHCAGATVRGFEIQLDPLKDTQCAAGTKVALARRDLKMPRNARSSCDSTRFCAIPAGLTGLGGPRLRIGSSGTFPQAFVRQA